MNYIEKMFKKTGWISILESLIFAIIGGVVIWNPEGTIKSNFLCFRDYIYCYRYLQDS